MTSSYSNPIQLASADIRPLSELFVGRVQENVPLSRLTTARAGGRADWFLEVKSSDEIIQAARCLWEYQLPFRILGGGSNILISDAGIREIVLYNRARRVGFKDETVWAESGANFGLLARQAAQRGLAGLEWAAGIPGSLGGAVAGNAGAHGGDISGNLLLADILQQNLHEEWPVERFEYQYRSSILKRRQSGQTIILAATLKLERSTPEAVQSKIEEFVAYRRRTQPPGASMGSMFKNPPGDYAGRLIEAAGLKGSRIGDAEISSLHANFFVNRGKATAADIYQLIELAREKVAEQSGIELELEIELLGEWA